MSGASDYVLRHTCPSCQTSFEARGMVCPRCGGVPAVESVRVAISEGIEAGLRKFRGGLTTRRVSRFGLLWCLALIPVLFGPPLIAVILIASIAIRERATLSSGQTLHLLAVAIVACVNLGFSAWVDSMIAVDVVAFAFDVKRGLQDWIREIFTIHVVPGGGMPGRGMPPGGRSA